MTTSAIRNWVFFALTSVWFSFARSYMHTYVSNDVMFAKVNSLTSLMTLLPFSYYSLPYCRPASIGESALNVGEALMGDQILSSPYRFRGNVNQSVYLCTTNPLNEQEARLLKHHIRHLYQVNMMLDGLPVIRYVALNGGTNFQWTGIPIGYAPPNSDDVYIINHLKFTVLVNEHSDHSDYCHSYKAAPLFEIVGFQVVPCSVKHDPENMKRLKMYDNMDSRACPLDLEKWQIVRENERISFTYEVQFVKSDICWQSRWDIYSKQEESRRIHWFSVLISLITVLLLTGIFFAIFLKTMSRELAKCQGLNKLAEEQANEEPMGWKLLAGDAFREPNHSRLLSVIIGTGVQITLAGFVTVTIAAFCFLTPDARGMILTLIIHVYSFSGIVGGYIGVRMWRTLKGSTDGWKSVSWSITFLFPGIILILHMVLNLITWNNRSTAVSISVYVTVLSLWFCISAPVTLLGGLLATWAKAIQYPVKINHIPREIPAWTLPSWLLVLGGGLIPFATLFNELYFFLTTIWLGRFYSMSGTLCLCLLALVILCAETSLIITYRNLQAGDWKWWWKSFFASGSASIYVFMFSINYLVSSLEGLSGPPSVTIYVGYSVILAIAALLSTGSIGFLASFYFVNALFSSTEI